MAVFLYALESWTLTADLQGRTQVVEMRCYRRHLGISYRDHVTNEEVLQNVKQARGQFEDLLTTVTKRKLKWYGHVTRTNGLSKTILQKTDQGSRQRGRQKKKWANNITDWTGKTSQKPRHWPTTDRGGGPDDHPWSRNR